jgi:circadian clock protein KaiB
MAKKYLLRLYVMGDTEHSGQAIINLKSLCKEYLVDYGIEVIDLKKNMAIAEREKIFATPMIERRLPLPIRRLVGDLSDKTQVLVDLDIITRYAGKEARKGPVTTGA